MSPPSSGSSPVSLWTLPQSLLALFPQEIIVPTLEKKTKNHLRYPITNVLPLKPFIIREKTQLLVYRSPPKPHEGGFKSPPVISAVREENRGSVFRIARC